MSRMKRYWYPGAVYHVMSRGNRHESIFKNEADYYDFLSCLEMVREKYSFTLYALCLMTNHFHLLIKTDDTKIGQIMQRLLLAYAANYNAKYNLSGHLFENRYASKLIEDSGYLLEVSRYIHLNPVKAFIVKDPLAYEYSSYGLFIRKASQLTSGLPGAGNTSGPPGPGSTLRPPLREGSMPENRIQTIISELVDTSLILSFFSQNPLNYRTFVEALTAHEEQEQQIRKDMHDDM